jgi:hypothetical protein
MTHRNRIVYFVSHLMVLVVLISSVTGNTSVSAKTAENSEPNVGVPQQGGNYLTTPELIEQAFARGEITAEQRILYLAYALYDYKSLPSQYLSSVGWFGDYYVGEVQAARKAAASGKGLSFSPTMETEFTRLLAQSATVCDMADGPYSTESDNFHLNFGFTGGGLTIDDYKTSLENVFSFAVTNYGWAKPPFCVSGIGTCIATNPWDKYPVQVADLGPGAFGHVQYGEGFGYIGQVGDNPNTPTPATETFARATCLVLNSDMNQVTFPYFLLTAQERLDRTTAHEFNHAIHHGYGPADEMWKESTASYDGISILVSFSFRE